MVDENKNVLDEAVMKAYESVCNLTPGTKEHTEAVDNFVTLYKLSLEELEKDREFMDRCERNTNNDRELDLKREQMRWERLRDKLKLGIETAGVIVPPAFALLIWKVGSKLEESASYTSFTFKQLIGWFKPTRR